MIVGQSGRYLPETTHDHGSPALAGALGPWLGVLGIRGAVNEWLAHCGLLLASNLGGLLPATEVLR
jgi:hypothetical protein